MRLYGEVFVSPIKAVSRRSREFWPRTTQFPTCASLFAHHLHSLLTLCLKLLAGLSQDSPVEQQKTMRFGADPDFMRLAFRCIFASIWICAWMLLIWCACLLCRFYGCVYSLYLCPCLRLCLCFCLCRCTGPCACACMCIVCSSIHIVKNVSLCAKYPQCYLGWACFSIPGACFQAAPIGPMVSRCDGTCCFGVNLRVDGACKLRGGVVHVPNISWASAVEYTVPCWSSPKSCKIQLLGSYPEKAPKAWSRLWG